MTKLYEIANEYRLMMDSIDETGEISPEVQEHLDNLEQTFGEKVDSICALIREEQAAMAALKTEIDRLEARKYRAQKRIDSLKEYLSRQMWVTDQERVRTTTNTVYFQKAGRPSIRWTGPIVQLPQKFQKTVISLDGTAAYEAWKAGDLDHPNYEVSQTTSLVIR